MLNFEVLTISNELEPGPVHVNVIYFSRHKDLIVAVAVEEEMPNIRS